MSVAVVTGASRGIGAAIARRLASDGMAVAVAATSADSARSVAEEIATTSSVETLPVGMLVEDHGSVAEGLDRVEAVLGPIDVMVNNAGIAGVASLLDYDPGDFARVVAINLVGVFNGMQLAARRMVASGTKGSIVNLGSVSGIGAFPRRAAYSSTKAAVHQLTRVGALDLAEHGIRVNCVAPGYIRTDMVETLIEAGTLDEARLQGRVPMGELGRPDDIAAAVSWLVSDEARYVTGETTVVDGGWTSYGHV